MRRTLGALGSMVVLIALMAGQAFAQGSDSAYHTFGGGGFGAGKIFHPGYKAGAIGAGAYDPSPSSGTRTIYLDSSSSRGAGGGRSGESAAPIKATFVHTYASHSGEGRSAAGRGLGGNVARNHVSRNPSYWRDRSYFFGYGSPFGAYLGYPWWWPGYGNRFGYPLGLLYGIGGFGFGGYGYGYPYLAYQSTYPYNAYNGQPTVQDGPLGEQLEDSLDYASQGEIAFRAGKYQQAVQDWRHALIDDPQNGAILLVLSQALFAAGQHVEAAGALQTALNLLPEDKWAAVISHYQQLYPNIQAYTDEIRVAEKLRNDQADLAPVHLLLGYHFGYLGYPKQAVRELEKAVELSPKDEISRRLLAIFSDRLNSLPRPAELVPDPAQQNSPAAPSSSPTNATVTNAAKANPVENKPAENK